jgi:hypothetical protein
MQTTYSNERIGVRASFPDTWAPKEQSPDSVVLVPKELSEQDLRFVPASVILALRGERFDEAVRKLMSLRTGYPKLELEPAEDGRWTSSQG